MCAKQVKKSGQDVGTTGHSWDGIEELNNPLPRWWVWVFYACIVWGIGYTIAYPAWPLINGATPGLLGASTRADVAAEIKRFDDANGPIKAKLIAADLTAIAGNEELKGFATSAGASVFKNNCAACHGSGAAGVQGKGYPNLRDGDWLYGGDAATIHQTLMNGRQGKMPTWSAMSATVMSPVMYTPSKHEASKPLTSGEPCNAERNTASLMAFTSW